jgi:ppGpp synthetase/RelA/SpoT-type nucleotidyltranferase
MWRYIITLNHVMRKTPHKLEYFNQTNLSNLMDTISISGNAMHIPDLIGTNITVDEIDDITDVYELINSIPSFELISVKNEVKLLK